MIFASTTIFATGSAEPVATRNLPKRVDATETASRKHFLEAYAEHLEMLKRARSAK